MNQFARQDVRCLKQASVNGYAAFVGEIGIGDRGPVNF